MRAALVGMKHRPPALDVVERLPDGTKLLLVREPGNTFDRNAVAVYFQLGYIPRSAAAKLAPVLDNQTNLVGVAKAEFQYHPQWPQLEIDDGTKPPPPPPDIVTGPPTGPAAPSRTPLDDDEIPF